MGTLDPGLDSVLGILTADGNRSGILGNVQQAECVRGSRTFRVPYFERHSAADIDDELFSDLDTLNSHSLQEVQRPPLSELLPDGVVTFSKASNSSLAYKMAVNDNGLSSYHRLNYFIRYYRPSEGFGSGFGLDQRYGRLSLMNLINSAFLSFLGLGTIQSWQQPMWYEQDPLLMLMSIVDKAGSLLYPVALCLLLPVFIHAVVMEKEERLREMMKIMGMGMDVYWASVLLFNLLIYAFMVAVFMVAGSTILHVRFFTQTHPLVFTLLFTAWGLAQVSLAVVLSSLLSGARAATMVGYMVALMGSLVSMTLNLVVYPTDSGPLPWYLLAYPHFAFARGIYVLNSACAHSRCVSIGDIFSPPQGPASELPAILFWLYFQSAVLALVGLYLDTVLSAEYGVPKHPLFWWPPVWRFLRRLWADARQRLDSERHTRHTGDEAAMLLPRTHDRPTQRAGDVEGGFDNNLATWLQEAAPGPVPPIASQDPDVRTEHERVLRGDVSSNCPIIVTNLSKRYSPTSKPALDGVCLAVEKGEFFGLLGPNGAGKSTFINILVGLYQPTGGRARVAGFDIATDMDKARLLIGVCPQNDTLWSTLTVREHLLFYSRLKGVEPAMEDVIVRRTLEDVHLLDAADRKAAHLSGGMRRRLSIAIALIGDPRIVFLDEPSSGLDPKSRRQIWEILARNKAGRAMMVTTHSMEEAEVLCTRIGILADGRLRCLGSASHLKKRYAPAYHVTVNYVPVMAPHAISFLRRLLPEGTLTSAFDGSCEYQVPICHMSFSKVFTAMEAQKEQHGITAWGVSETSLEDVFLRIVEAP